MTAREGSALDRSPILISREEVRELLDWPAVLEATRAGLILAESQPGPSMVSAQVQYAYGSLHLKAAALDVKRIISVKSNLRPARGGVSGVLLAYDLDAERLAGIIDAGLMTAMRTGAIAAIAAERLVAPGPITVAALGVGPVGLQSLRALFQLLDVHEVRLWSNRTARAIAVADELNSKVPATPHVRVAEAISGADIIITATPSGEPILTTDGLKPDVIILAMGADTVGKRELTTQVLERSDVIADVPGEALRVGESAHLPEERRNSVMSLARCLTSTDDVHREHEFLVVDSVGSSYVDAAVTSIIMSRAVERGVGHEIAW